MDAFSYVFIGIITILVILNRYIESRNDAVFEFIMMVINKYGTVGYEQLPSYNRLLFSFKKLTVENYLPELLSHESAEER